MPTIGAFAVVLDQESRVLLCRRRDRDAWNLPGGGATSGELPTAAAVRETLEETGLDIALVRLVGIYLKPAQDDMAFVFQARPVRGEPMATAESHEVRWFKPDEFPPSLFPSHLERICDALESGTEPVFRVQSTTQSNQLGTTGHFESQIFA